MNHRFSCIAACVFALVGTSQATSKVLLRPFASSASDIQLVHEGHAGATKASGVVNSVDAAQRKVNLSLGSIKKLGWPAMTMDFPVGGDVDLTVVKSGMRVNFTLVKGSGGVWTVDALKAANQ